MMRNMTPSKNPLSWFIDPKGPRTQSLGIWDLNDTNSIIGFG